MTHTDEPMSGSDDEVRSARLLLERLTTAIKRRRRLGRGTLEYARALEAEERLAHGIWHRVSVVESRDRGEEPVRRRHPERDRP